MMMKINLLLIAILGIGCHEYSFGFYGNNVPTTSTKVSPPVVAPTANGLIQSCTLDEQCGDNLICYKEDINKNYIGVCAHIK